MLSETTLMRKVERSVYERTLDELLNSDIKKDKSPYLKIVKAKPHSPVYMMHKFWARRPYNVFAQLISHYTKPDDIILDPFCGGGVTVVEALRLKRRVVGVDINPLATYVTEMEVTPVSIENVQSGYEKLKSRIEKEVSKLYQTICPVCGSKDAIFDWLEWDEVRKKPIRLKYKCPKCGVGERDAQEEDLLLSRRIDEEFDKTVLKKELWYPKAKIPMGDKTKGLLKKGYTHFFQLYTKRNLLALALLFEEISLLKAEKEVQDFLQFAVSGSLKWASKQSHLRGKVVEGWAIHAYWVYPKTLEINVWNTFTRRCYAIVRGKKYANKNIGVFFKKAELFEDLLNGKATCLILTQSSKTLPIPKEKIDIVITDPPFGGNVNYGELADYWMVWKDEIIDKSGEVIINKTQEKALSDYEEGLKQVFDECFRVLKKEGYMVVTFNSKDLRVVASFVIATARAGFLLHPQGLLYQPPIRAYTTTFHAMQVGAFTGDFVFTFYKPKTVPLDTYFVEIDLENFRRQIANLVKNHLNERVTEPEFREKAYKALIPFLAIHSRSNLKACREVVEYFEAEMRKLRPHFKKLREKIIKERRQMFLAKKNKIKKE